MPSPNASFDATFRADQILVQFADNSNAAEHSHALEAIGGRLLDIVSQGADGDLSRIGLGQGVTVEKAIAILSHLPGVKFAEPDFVVQAQTVSNDPGVLSGQTWGLYGDVGAPTNVYGSQATEAWAAGATGSMKVAVGVVDSGVDYTHPDLYQNIWLNQREIPIAFKAALSDIDGDKLITFRDLNAAVNGAFVSDLNANGRIDAGDLLRDARWADHTDQDGNGYVDDLIGWDFVNNDNDPMDDQGHGTHVAGTIAAQGGDGAGVAGVAWSAQVVVLKFLDASNYGYTSNNIKAEDYFTNASKAGTGIDFVATNNSWGGAGFSQALLDAVTRAAKADIFYVAAAGNNAADNDVTPFYPASLSTLATAGYEAVISVAALTSSGSLASYSDYGAATVDIAAPGSSIYSTAKGGGYVTMSGTSMATPFVTGAIALYAAAHPAATAAQIQAALLASAAPTASVLDKVLSDGRLDISAFLNTYGDPILTPVPAPSNGGVVIVGTAGSDALTPTSSATLAPTPYADTLSGLSGDDTLDGGAGADSLAGGLGNDLYVLDNNSDVVLEGFAEGLDTVQASFSYTLGANFENLTLSSSVGLSGTGNEIDNRLNGNSGSNLLSGMDGNDYLDGLGGNDTLVGGQGTDTLSGGTGDDDLSGGAGGDLFIGGAGKDEFLMKRGEIAGDAIQDFAKGDHLLLSGFSAGSSVARVAGSAVDWQVIDHSTGMVEVFKLLNSYALRSGDFLFV